MFIVTERFSGELSFEPSSSTSPRMGRQRRVLGMRATRFESYSIPLTVGKRLEDASRFCPCKSEQKMPDKSCFSLYTKLLYLFVTN